MKQLIDYYKAMSDETRVRIVNLLIHAGELCVCDLEMVLELSQPKISRHLAYLRESGLVKDRKNGLWVYYQMENQLTVEVSSQLNAFKESVSFNDQLKSDIIKLRSLANSNSCKAEVSQELYQINLN